MIIYYKTSGKQCEAYRHNILLHDFIIDYFKEDPKNISSNKNFLKFIKYLGLNIT